jgi:asparagine synthetase B (glutamine-hydrolysing)
VGLSRADDAHPVWLAIAESKLSRSSVDDELVFSAHNGAESLRLRLPPGSGATLAVDDGIVVVFDGQLHDTVPLKRAVGEITVRPEPDAELVLRAYKALGLTMVQRLKGDFALIVWEHVSGDLVLVRDRLGNRPLCYAELEGDLLVSPSSDAVVSAGAPRDVDAVAVAEWVLDATLESSKTLYRHVYRLPPGHFLERRGRRTALSRYWQPPTDRSTGDPRDAHETFDRILRESVRRALDAGPAGIFLSGGLDSAVVAAVTAEESHLANLPAPMALSMRFTYADADEAAVQRAVADDLALPLTMMTLGEASGPEGTLIASLRLSERDSLPALSAWAGAYETLALEGVRNGCTSILTGEGGNLVMEPTWGEMSDLLVGLRFAELRRLVSEWARYDSSATRFSIYRAVLRHSAARTRRHLVAAAARQRSPTIMRRRLGEALDRRIRVRIPSWAVPDRQVRRRLVEKQATAWWATLRSDSPLELDPAGTSLALEASSGMARRLRISVSNPYYDPELVSLRARAPLDVLLLDGRYKGLGQASYSRRVAGPSAAMLRTVSFERAFETLLRREIPLALGHLGGLTSLLGMGIIRPEAVALLRGECAADEMGYYQRWQILACEAWLRSHA